MSCVQAVRSLMIQARNRDRLRPVAIIPCGWIPQRGCRVILQPNVWAYHSWVFVLAAHVWFVIIYNFSLPRLRPTSPEGVLRIIFDSDMVYLSADVQVD